MKTYLLIGAGHCRDKRVVFDSSEKVGPGSPEKDFSEGKLVTLDFDPGVEADICHDLDVLPYPLGDDLFDEIHAYEVLEHCGTQGDARFFFNQFYEFWRTLKNGGYFIASVPMWDCEVAWGVPDHKRVLPKSVFEFLTPKYAERLGQPGVGDYRHYLHGMEFEPLDFRELETQLYVVLRAHK